MAVTLSADGLEAIARHEGLRLTAYKPVAAEQFWTIGYGHYGPDVRAGQRITRERALELLREDVASAVASVRRGVHVVLDQGKFDALVSFTFNVGGGAFAGSTLLKRVNARQWAAAAHEFGRWVRDASGHALDGLVKRRATEAAMFLAGSAQGAASWLTPVELRRVRELDALRKAGKGRSDRAQVLAGVLTEQRKRIWRAAQGAGGWDAANRRERYRSLLARTS